MRSYLSEYFIEEIQKHLSIMLLFLMLAMSGLYFYLVNSSVINTVTREKNIKEITGLTPRVSKLEDDYMALKSVINIDMAHFLGFKDDFSKVHFSSENTNVAGSVSLLGNEI